MTSSSAFAEMNRLKSIEHCIQKGLNTSLDHLKKHPGISEVVEFVKELEISRKSDLTKLHNRVASVCVPVQNIKKLLQEKDFDNIDVDNFKEEMIKVQLNLEQVQTELNATLSKLEMEEMQLRKELELYEDLVEEWEEPIKITNYTECRRTRYKSAGNAIELCQEAKDFLSFVTKSGGHEGGWPMEDHLLFLKLKKNYKSEEELANSVHKILPDLSVEEIIAHNKWYEKYTALKDKQKSAIQNWRRSKTAPTHTKETRLSATVGKLQTRFQQPTDVKAQLTAWKRAKEEKLKVEKRVEQQTKIQLKETDEERRKRNEQLKKVVNDWRNMRLEKERAQLLDIEKAQRSEKNFKVTQAKTLIKQFQSQDDLYIQRKRSILKARTQSADPVMPKKDAPRDPNRLLKPTKQWTQRIQANTDKSFISDQTQRKFERLGVPEWRRGIEYERFISSGITNL